MADLVIQNGPRPLTDAELRASEVPVSLASIPSHPVTNAGTFAVQVTSAPTTAVTGTFFQATQPVSIAATVAVSAASLPLPTGASTSALQTTGNTSLSSIDTKLTTTNSTLTTIDGRVDGLETLATSANTKLDTLITDSANKARGTTAALSSVTAVAALNAGSQTLLAAAALSARKGVTIFNNTNRTIFVLFGGGTANTTTSYSVQIQSGAYYEVPSMFANVAIQYSISQASATGTVLVSTVN